MLEEQDKSAAFQAALLTLLDQKMSPQEMMRTLSTDPQFEVFRQYVQSFDLDMIEVASVLVKKWGQKTID
jgi:hypothetical protein